MMKSVLSVTRVVAALFLSGIGLPLLATAASHELRAKDTLAGIELDRGDTVHYTLANGEVRTIELVSTSARVLFTTLKEFKKPERGAAIYEMTATVKFDGHPLELRRYVASQEAFYEPYVINGVRLWFDAVADVADFLGFNHGDCRPTKHARFALQDATKRICPEELLPWYPNPRRFIDIADSYNGNDCWMGPIGGNAHGGLDINQPAGTVNYTPLALDDHFYFDSLAKGQNNNRWRGVRRWASGEVWKIQNHHILSLLVPEHSPLAAGDPVALAAGVRIGDHTHSHYNLKVRPAGAEQDIDLDPWILFWQIFQDEKARAGDLRANMAPVRPAKTGVPVSLAATGSRPGPGRKQLQHSWSFGDGGGSLEPAPSHVFARPGVYPITLTVSDGANLATTTQHITVDGNALATPALALAAPDEPLWWPRPLDAQDVYGIAPRVAPRTLEFLARPTQPKPRAREIRLVNLGGGVLPTATVRVDYVSGRDWLTWERAGDGNAQVLRMSVDGANLPGARYTARLTVETPGAANAAQSFAVNLLVPTHPPMALSTATVDNAGIGFSATPWFWIGHRFNRVKERGHNDFYLLNGRRDREDGLARFTPDLRRGRYEVAFSDQTPFSPDARFAVRIRHADGEETRWIEPAVSRAIGTFAFEEGVDGFVEISTAGSRGQVCADAVVFRPPSAARSK